MIVLTTLHTGIGDLRPKNPQLRPRVETLLTCAAESTPGRAGARLSYDSRVTPQQRTSREKRERREQRAARKAGTVATTPATAVVVD